MIVYLVALQLLKDQKTDIKGFADSMQRLATVKEHVPSLKEKVEYIKNLYEVREVVAQLYLWFKFNFPLFLGMVGTKGKVCIRV